MVSKAYAWITTTGGAWSLASNWDDQTDGIDPSLTVPGPQDSVTVPGPTGSSVMTLTGQGAVLAATFSGNAIIIGTISAGTVSLGAAGAGGLLDIGLGGSLQAGTLTAASGSVIASGANSRIAAATLTLGAGQSGGAGATCNLDATSGGILQAASLVLDAGTAAVYVDPASSIEVGTLGGTALGALTVDAGALLSGQGDANAYANVINNGTITASGGTLTVGKLTGTGLLNVGAGAVLELNGVTGAGQNVVFAGAQGTLALAMELDAPQGVLTGFTSGDAIDELGSPISDATYALTKAGLGVLTLYYGNQVADTLTLAGTYTNDVFLTASDGEGGTLITVAPSSGGGGGASGGTANPDQYAWTAPSGGNWNAAANWQDLTTGANPAKIAPGVHDLVTIAAPQTGFDVIAGPANAAALAITGDVALGGVFSIGTLTLGQSAGNGTDGVLDLLPAAQMTAATAAIEDGGLSVSGSAVLAVTGTLTLGGGSPGIGLPVTSLAASAGGTVTAVSLTIGGGSGDSITTDPSGVIEIGTAGGAAAGAVTIDAGATLTGNGSVNPFGAVVDNGTITALGGVLTLGSVTGAGGLAIGAGSALDLNASTALPVTFIDDTGILAVADELVGVTGTLTGFLPGDTIDILNDPITGFSTGLNNGNTNVTLYYGSTAVWHVTLAGSYAGYHFILTPDGNNGTDLSVALGHGGGGGGGQGDTDLLAWAQPGSGAWGKTGNWYDVTTGSAALAPPGTENAVQLTGAQGSFQVIGGPGVCASLSCYGDSLLNAAFTTGTLAVGGALNGTATAAIVDIAASASLTATVATVDGGTLLASGTASALTIAGTIALGGVNDGTLAVSNHGTARMLALSLGGLADSAITADITSSAEIGTLNTGAAGAVTVDAGFAITGFGAVNPDAPVVDNGTITAQGGTLEIGAVSGTGALAIAGEATLALSAGDAVPIVFTGGGGTLLLQGSEETPAGIISGFAPGDLIVAGSSQLSAAAYTPGAGGVGTLTLYEGTLTAGTLRLAGSFSGDIFTVQPDGDGTAIGVQSTGGGPSPGTPTPDNYVWTGNAGTLWNSAANWNDITAGQSPAAIAPGAHDLDTIHGGTGTYTAIAGPADAASLAIFGNVALSGQYTIGALAVEAGAATGALALGSGTNLQDATATIAGAVLAQGAIFATSGVLALASGLLQATGAAEIEAGAAVLTGAATITTDASSSVEIGTAGAAAAGAVTVDNNAILAGAGAVNPQGAITDNGTITASGGTLILGAVAGTGVLDIGVDAALTLAGAAAPGLLIDFTGPGTLTAATALPLSAIAGFGEGDAILLPIIGATDAVYAATAPGLGVLTLSANGQTLGQLTLEGVGLGQSFALASTPGGTVLTTQTTTWGGGGSNMRNQQPGSGSGSSGVVQDFSWWQSLPGEVQTQLVAFQNAQGNNCYVWTSPDGTGGSYMPGYANFAVAAAPPADSWINLAPGYQALLAQGSTNVLLGDGKQGNALIMGNAGNDTIMAGGDNDTLVGGVGGNNVFFSANAGNAGTRIYGSGNDTIVTGNAPAWIQTAASGRSTLFLGPGNNQATLNGTDTVISSGGAGANDTVVSNGSNVVFGPSEGQLIYSGGPGNDTLVAGAGTFVAHGGGGQTLFWAGYSNYAEYFGGAGSATIIGDTGQLSVQGSSGAITVFGGSGQTTITGAPGPSAFLLGGGGAATVTAAAGNVVYLAGAGNDSLIASGGNILFEGAGATGNAVFQAGNGPVTIYGGLGADTFIGGHGNATMTGGSGSDVFSFTNGLSGGIDVIAGFKTATGQIDLHGYAGYTSMLFYGNELLTLSDGTRILLSGVSSLTGVHISVS